MSAGGFRNYWCMTWNKHQLEAVAMGGEGVYEQDGPHYSEKWRKLANPQVHSVSRKNDDER